MMIGRPLRTLAAGLALAAAALLAAPPRAALATGGPEPGEKAPELEVEEWVNGQKLVLAEQAGSVVVILFFATNAPEMNEYVKGYCNIVTTYGARGLKVIGVSRENSAILLNWADEAKVNFPLAVDDGSWKGRYGIDGYPYTYIVDVYGEIAWKGDGNHLDWVIPQTEKCLKEVKRVTVKRESTSKNFDKVWRALDKNEYPNAIKFLDGLAKGADEDDKKNAEAILKDLNAIADARLARVAELEKRKDYVSGESILKTVEKLFVGLPQSKAAKEKLASWMKDAGIRNELEAQKLYEEGRTLETAKQYKRAAAAYRAAMGFPGTRAASRAQQQLAAMVQKGLVKG